jgi:cytochrome c biogenesis protein CcdA
MPLGSYGLAFVAGLLSTLSPCVLPLLPIVIGAAASEHRFGPAALAAGLSLSYVAFGIFAATIGFSIGLGGDLFRGVGAAFLVIIGGVLLMPRLQTRLAVAGGPVGNWFDQRVNRTKFTGIGGQFGAGLLLGAIWSPCVGPTLGAALVLAARQSDLPQVALTMLLFGLGAGLPLAALGLLSREALLRSRQRLGAAGKGVKAALGATFIVIGALILTGLDRTVETALVEASPDLLTRLTTSF